MGFTVTEGSALRRGSEKAISRRCLERPLGEYAPTGVRPTEFERFFFFFIFFPPKFSDVVPSF